MTRSKSLFCGSADTMEKRSSAGINKEHYHAHWPMSFFPGDLEPHSDHLAMRHLLTQALVLYPEHLGTKLLTSLLILSLI